MKLLNHRMFRRYRLLTRLFLILVVATVSPAASAEEKTITLKPSELEALIDARIAQRLEALNLNTPNAFNDRVATGIMAFIQNQQAAKVNETRGRAKLARAVKTSEHIYGDPQAPFSIIEYSDYECPYCKRFHVSKTLNKFVAQYDGQVNWVYRHFPLDFHNPNAQKQAEATECANELAGNKGFWKFSDELYKRTSSNKGFATSRLLPLAVELGLDESSFSECFNSGRYTNLVKQDFADGQKAGISGTPGNILRHNETGTSVAVSGAVPLQMLVKEMEALASSVGVPLN